MTAVEQFFNDQTSGAILSTAYDHVVDAIDSVAKKTLLLRLCREKDIPVTCCGGAGGRRDSTQIRTADLSRVSHDRLLAAVRKKLRQECGFPADGAPMGLPCVYSAEPPVFAQPDGSVCGNRPGGGEDTRLNCNGGLGSATYVTGAFGFAAAGLMVESIVSR